jgi:hypothetical protein
MAQTASRKPTRPQRDRLGKLGVDNVWIFLPFVLFYPHLRTRVSLPAYIVMGTPDLPF